MGEGLGLCLIAIVIFIVAIACCGGCFMLSGTPTASGSHEATIYAMQENTWPFHNFNVWVVYSGQMVDSGDNYTFDANDRELYEKLKTAMECKQKVRIDFREQFYNLPWEFGTGTIITGVTNSTV